MKQRGHGIFMGEWIISLKSQIKGPKEKKYTVKQVAERFQEPEEGKKHSIAIETKDTRVSEKQRAVNGIRNRDRGRSGLREGWWTRR